MFSIERRPRIERRRHFAAARRRRQMTERAVAYERLSVSREETVENRSRGAVAGRRNVRDARRDGTCDESESQQQALAHEAIIDL
jgi:hypothetical protein